MEREHLIRVSLEKALGEVAKDLKKTKRIALYLAAYSVSSIPSFVGWLSHISLTELWIVAVVVFLLSVVFFSYFKEELSRRVRLGAIGVSAFLLVALSLVSWYRPIYKSKKDQESLNNDLKKAKTDLDQELYSDALNDYTSIISKLKGKAETPALSDIVFEAECGVGVSQRFLGQIEEAKKTLDESCVQEVTQHSSYNRLIFARARQALGHIYRVQGDLPRATAQYKEVESILAMLEKGPEVAIQLADLQRGEAHLQLEDRNLESGNNANVLLDNAEKTLPPRDVSEFTARRARVEAEIYRIRQFARAYSQNKNVDCASPPPLPDDADLSNAIDDYNRLLSNVNLSKRVSAHIYLGLGQLVANTDQPRAEKYLNTALGMYRDATNTFGQGQVYLAYAKLFRQKHSTLPNAESHAKNAITEFRKIDATAYEADAYRESGVIKSLECKLVEARSDLNEARERYLNIGSTVVGCIDAYLKKLEATNCQVAGN